MENNSDKPKILFVDDERNILSALNRLFIDEDYELLTAHSAFEGLDILREMEVQVIVSDQRMPMMTGVDFLIQAKELRPDAIKIILTGYTDIDAAMRAINEGSIYKFITKPWNDEELKLVIRRALDFFKLQKENKEFVQIIQKQNAELLELNETLNQRVLERTRTIFQKNQELNQLNKQLTESFHKVLKLLVNLLEMRSKELCGHSKRVAAASRYIAAEMALSDRELDTIEIAALLHDIGKINLPEKLIAKSDSLMSPEELNLWRQHPLLGERALANIEQLMEVRRIIRHHHENYIGNGYPDGLRGEEIPLASRIIAVTDNYDKMANKVYMNVDNTRLRAMKAIRLKAGVELDGQIVRKLMDLLQKQKEKEKVKTKRELEIKPFELKENMILSRDLYTSRGVLVYPKDKRLDTVDIQAILETDKLEKLFTSVFVLL